MMFNEVYRPYTDRERRYPPSQAFEEAVPLDNATMPGFRSSSRTVPGPNLTDVKPSGNRGELTVPWGTAIPIPITKRSSDLPHTSRVSVALISVQSQAEGTKLK